MDAPPTTFPWYVAAAWVAVGGAVGSVARYGVTVAAAVWTAGFGSAPVGTVLVNWAGCAALGCVIGSSAGPDPPTWLCGPIGVGVRFGLLGGLTTFSTFVGDAYGLSSRSGVAVGYVAANLIGGGVALVAAATITRGWGA